MSQEKEKEDFEKRERLWKEREEKKSIASLEDFTKYVENINKGGRGGFLWRGQRFASWPLHHTLHREYLRLHKEHPNEKQLLEMEETILNKVEQWSLHYKDHQYYSTIAKWSLLRHYGSPSRFLDMTSDPFLALWFAVQEYKDEEKENARIFAIEPKSMIKDKTESADLTLGKILEDQEEILKKTKKNQEKDQKKDQEKKNFTLAIRPIDVDKRVNAQRAAFLFGYLPRTSINRTEGGSWSKKVLLKILSLGLTSNKKKSTGGLFTVQVDKGKKEEIREALEKDYACRSSRFFPDYAGFTAYAIPEIFPKKPSKKTPPKKLKRIKTPPQ